MNGMHEISIIENIMKVITENAEANQLRSISRISLKIGKMRQVVPEMLNFAFETVAQDTVAEKAALDVEYIQILMKCKDCGKEFSVENKTYLCPHCDSRALDLLTGQEMYLDSIEGEQ